MVELTQDEAQALIGLVYDDAAENSGLDRIEKALKVETGSLGAATTRRDGEDR